jgi:hypothetical protein
MFDWARGSVLKILIDRGVFRADWDPLNTQRLKNWSASWFLETVTLSAGLKLLDVGSANPYIAQHISIRVRGARHGCPR